MHKKVLLTGASGFIGRYCYDLLESKGYEVIPISYHTTYRNSLSNFDLLDKYTRQNLIDSIRPDYLLHLAWDVKPGYKNSDNNILWFNASIDLLQHFYRLGGKFALTVGSCFEYDLYHEDDGICKEYKTPLIPDTIYGQCKKQMYEYLRLWSIQNNYRYSHARLFYLYGPNEFNNRFLPSIINGLLQNKSVDLSSGVQIRDFLYVEDVADALVSILDLKIPNLLFNVGSGDGISLKKLAFITAQLVNGNKKLLNFGVRPDNNEPLRVIANTYLLNTLINWTPKFSLEDGLKKTIEYWRNNNGN